MRGFEEESEVQTDFPTTAKDIMRLFFALSSTLKWPVGSMDVKSAFLQGNEISHEIFVYPPPEAQVPKRKLWKLRKAVYGLNDISIRSTW